MCDMSLSLLKVTCPQTMGDLVDKLRTAIGVKTDTALADELGLERSTVAQWRRRGSLPQAYRAILDAHTNNQARVQPSHLGNAYMAIGAQCIRSERLWRLFPTMRYIRIGTDSALIY